MTLVVNWVKKYWPILLLSLYYGLFFIVRINLTGSDLGRHITNGRVILESGQVFSTNFYSYTQPDFPVTNHHWLFGVMAYFGERALGFGGLTLVNAVLISIAVGLMMFVSLKKVGEKNQLSVIVATVITLPLITSRLEIRPETISILMIGLYFWLLSQKNRSWLKLGAVLVFLQIIWTNTHLFFIFGPVVVGYFWLKSENNKKELLLLLLSIIASSLLNPLGWRGAIEPLNIFQEYGYVVAENQSVWFMIKRLGEPRYYYLLASFVVIIISSFLAFRKKLSNYWPELLLILSFGLVGLKVNRMMSFFGFVSITILSLAISKFQPFAKKELAKLNKSPALQITISMLGFGALVIVFASGLFFPNVSRFGLGLYPGISNSAVFYRNQNIAGPVFNNYDIGGYLIYYLYPDQKVFIDNRPEAYPSDFIQNEYVAAQENDEAWKKLNEKYQFNSIYFYRHDMTPWAQPFLIERVKDPNWEVVYFDDYVVIFVKNSEQNKELIDQYKIPSEVFGY